MKRIQILVMACCLVWCCSNIVRPQGNLVPVYDNVYEYLERMELKGVLPDYSGLVLPKTRLQVAEHLHLLRSEYSRLSLIEREELAWYEREYAAELAVLRANTDNITEPIEKRWNLFSYNKDGFAFSVDPILGVTYSAKYGDTEQKRWNGAGFFSSLQQHNIGVQMDFRDHAESGSKIDSTKRFSAEHGINILGGSANSFEYSEVKGAVGYETRLLSIFAGKEWHKWGSGYRSRLILSDKAPSFPFIRLEVHPAPWLNFYYMHGWLNSRVPDSSRFYNTLNLKNDSTYYPRVVDREKFYALHFVEVIPWDWMRFSLGESIIYSDQGPRLGYLIPVLFFRLVDHYYEGTDGYGKGSNSQLFSDLRLRLPASSEFYSTFFIDELSLKDFFSGKFNRNQLGFTVGAKNYGALLPGLMLRAEYTRILPWVYSNMIPAQTYASSNFLLGHYIGQNADQLYLQADYRFMRRLEARVWVEHNRAGGFLPVTNQYKDPGEDFLYKPVRKETAFGMQVSYEYLHGLNAVLTAVLSNVSDEDPARTKSFMRGSNSAVSISLYYGL